MRRVIGMALLMALPGCGDVSDITWRVELGSSLAGERVVYVEGRILNGGCDGGVWYASGRFLGSGVSLPVPAPLDDGLWAFAGRASDASCGWFAEGCVERRLPDDTSEVVIVLERGVPPFEARCTDCDGGICPTDTLPPPRILSPAPGAYFFAGAGVPVAPTFRFAPSRGATHHVVEVSAPCMATRTSECDFDAPTAVVMAAGTATSATLDEPLETSLTPPVGARYAVRIKGCDVEGCIASAPRAFHVGRQPTDLDGDGLGDMVVGAPAASEVFALSGTADLTTMASVPIAGAPVPSRGTALAVGDLDADGFADVLVGSPFTGGSPPDVGQVALHRGASGGPLEASTIDHPAPIAASTFGSALAVLGDVDGDGFDDFAVGAPQHGRGGDLGGAVFVFFGGPDLDGELRALTLTSTSTNGDARFGSSVGGGDVDGDGYADVLVGAPRADVGAVLEAGRVFLFRGPTLASVTALELDAAPVTNALFGAAVATVGDLDGDGRADLVVGAPGEQAAYLYLGDAAGIAVGRVEVTGGSATLVSFGETVAALGDVDGDGVPDFAVGDSGHGGTGGAFIYSGADRGSSWLPSPILDAAASGAGYGTAIGGMGDADGDGDPDIVVGGPGDGGGRVEVFRSTGRDLDTTPATGVTGTEVADRFGAALGAAPAR